MYKYKILGTLVLCLSFQANAALYNFSYTSSAGDILAGSLDGTLQSDGNTVFVNSVADVVTINGAPTVSLPFVSSQDELNYLPSPGLSPALTLDGSFMDFMAATDSAFTDGILFSVNNLSAINPLFNTGQSFGSYDEEFVATNWHLAPVPLPASFPLMAMAFASLGWRRLRQST